MDFTGFDKLFQYGFDIVIHIGKYVIAVKMATNVMRNYESGNLRDMIQDVISGGFAFGTLTYVLHFLDNVAAALNPVVTNVVK